MKIKVLLKANKIPIFYRNIIMSLIKEALYTYDEKYLNQFYLNYVGCKGCKEVM